METEIISKIDPIFISYFALTVGALVPIYFGSYGSVVKPKKEKKSDDEESDDEDVERESLSSQDALMFPVTGSIVLFGLYLLFNYFSKEYINYLLTAYFAAVGIFALSKVLASIVKTISPLKNAEWNQLYKLRIFHKKEAVYKFSFDYLLIGSFVVSVFFTAYYVITKNWIASNIYGLAFATSAIQLLSLDDFKTGLFLLSGLFFYDIFWVFGTEVMVTVAKNFDAPIKLLFPRDIFAEEYKFAMLGLGDIVIPGIFIALCLRYDHYRGGEKSSYSKPYFISCFVAYILGLAATMFVMHTFKAAQPALLYLSPACILSTLGVALVKGDLKGLFAYSSPKDDELKKKIN